MEIITLVLVSVLPVLVISAGLMDLTTMTISNRISLALMVGFFPAALAVGLTPIEVAGHLGVAVGLLALGIGLFAMRLVGGGDAKLIAGAGLWLGLDAGLAFVVVMTVLGGLFSLALVMARGNLAAQYVSNPVWLGRLLTPQGDIPYGVAIAGAALVVYPHSPLFQAFLFG